MTDNHPITPSPDLVQQWLGERYGRVVVPGEASIRVATKAARWGSDQELEACCDWLGVQETRSPQWFDLRHDACALVSDLRAARRPKPLSLKEHALETLHSMQIEPCVINGVNTNADLMAKYDIIRRALETVND